MAPPKGRRRPQTGKYSIVKSKPQQCLFCMNIYHNYNILENHTNIHTEEHPYECKECGETFTYYTYLCRHQTLVHLGQRYHCKFCSASYVGNQDLRSHMDRIHYGKKYICDGCKTQYSSQVTLKRHRDGGFCKGVKKMLFSIKMRNMDKAIKVKREKNKVSRKMAGTGSSGRGTNKIGTEDSPANGSKARKVNARKNELKTENLKKLKPKQLEILKEKKWLKIVKARKLKEKCSKQPIKIEDNPISKMQTKSADDSKKRSKCSKIRNVRKLKVKFSENKVLKIDKDDPISKVRTKSADSKKRSKCSKSFKVRKSIGKPLAKKIQPKKRQLKCSICQTTHSDRNHLLRHCSEFHGRQIFECGICENVYTEYCNMYRHMKMAHSNDNYSSFGKRDTKCVECNLIFDSYSKLLQHKKDSHDLKLFKCTNCPNEYTDYYNMLRHRKSHDNKNGGKKVPGRVYTSIVKKSTIKSKSIAKIDYSVPGSPPILENYPVIGTTSEKTADSSNSNRNSVNEIAIKLINNLKTERNEKDDLFFLHLNRYDPSSI